MRTTMKKLIALTVLALFTITAVFAADLTGKTVILHSNDVHGSIAGYANIAQLRNEAEAAGAEVILVDAGEETTSSIMAMHSSNQILRMQNSR